MFTLPQIPPRVDSMPPVGAAPALRLPAEFEYLEPTRENRRRLRETLRAHGSASLLTAPAAQPKLIKNRRVTFGLSLAPAALSGLEVCAARGDCAAACVLGQTCGRAASQDRLQDRAGSSDHGPILRARIGRTRALAADPQVILSGIVWEMRSALRSKRFAAGSEFALRLNVGSDLPFERVRGFVDALDALGIRLYDYTKRAGRVGSGGRADGPAPYFLCLSASEKTAPDSLRAVLDMGGTVALVVAGLRHRHNAARYTDLPIPRVVRIGGVDYPTSDGDVSDDRSEDPRGYVVILRGKGKLQDITTGGARIGESFAIRADADALLY